VRQRRVLCETTRRVFEPGELRGAAERLHYPLRPGLRLRREDLRKCLRRGAGMGVRTGPGPLSLIPSVAGAMHRGEKFSLPYTWRVLIEVALGFGEDVRQGGNTRWVEGNEQILGIQVV
jgi:hypothetical protein